MPRMPRIETEEGRRLYREYVIERSKQIVGYGMMSLGIISFIGYRATHEPPLEQKPLFVILGIFAVGLIAHLSRTATKEAAKIKLERKRRHPPPPIESQVAGSRPNEISTGDYRIRFQPPSEEPQASSAPHPPEER